MSQQLVPIKLNRPEKCVECKTQMQVGDDAIYEVGSHLTSQGRTVYCHDCADNLTSK